MDRRGGRQQNLDEDRRMTSLMRRAVLALGFRASPPPAERTLGRDLGLVRGEPYERRPGVAAASRDAIARTAVKGTTSAPAPRDPEP